MFITIFVIVILVLLYFVGTRNFGYWKRKGVKHDKPYPFVGNGWKWMTFQVSFTDYFVDIYKKNPGERFIGLYFANQPTLIVTEPRDIQRVLILDFNCFHLRGMKLHKDDTDPMNNHLVNADGDIWKLLRTRMTPAFTTGKVKAMFPLIIDRADKLQVFAANLASKQDEVDVKDMLSRYTIDFIGACGFGLDMDALDAEDSLFRRLGKRIFTLTKMDVLRLTAKVIMPTLVKYVPIVGYDVTKIMTFDLVKSIMEERNYEPSSRNDFIDLLLEVKKKGKMVGESIEKKNPDGSPVIVEQEINDLLIAAQVYVFFAAGFETSSSNASFTLHQLAFYPDKQKKCQEEIDQVLSRYNGKLCYDAINEMKYLKMCFYEAMRLFPSLGLLFRTSASKYTFPDSDLTIDENIKIIIVIQAMQKDEKYFPNPEQYIPERFSPENEKNIPRHVYLPFGEGPRACIGGRLALMQSLAGLAAVLSNFSVAPSKNTKRYPEHDPRSGFIQTTKGGLPLKLINRKK